ncbi:MAG: class I SAM-dependent DNA methyltransferase [Pseudonocardiaceae bacterium]
MPRQSGDAEAPDVTVPPEHFDKLYADKRDPWDFAASWYEQRKYALTVASLPKQPYRACFEAGCSIGEMTKLLVQRCDKLVAVDCSPRAVRLARQALCDFGHVRVDHAVLPPDIPDMTFDLIVASEILYYFTADDLTALLDGLLARLEPGGDFVAAHWRASDRSYGYDGFNVHDALYRRPEVTPVVQHEDENFVLTVFR